MSIKFYGWYCVRCDAPVSKVKVGVSSTGNLVAMWKCSECRRDIIAEIPLEKIIADVPAPDEEQLAQAQRIKVILI